MYVVVNQKSGALFGPFETKAAALAWIPRKQAEDALNNWLTTYEVDRLNRIDIA